LLWLGGWMGGREERVRNRVVVVVVCGRRTRRGRERCGVGSLKPSQAEAGICKASLTPALPTSAQTGQARTCSLEVGMPGAGACVTSKGHDGGASATTGWDTVVVSTHAFLLPRLLLASRTPHTCYPPLTQLYHNHTQPTGNFSASPILRPLLRAPFISIMRVIVIAALLAGE